eukprot:4854602-Amphidinium_carterae.1
MQKRKGDKPAIWACCKVHACRMPGGISFWEWLPKTVFGCKWTSALLDCHEVCICETMNFVNMLTCGRCWLEGHGVLKMHLDICGGSLRLL